MQSAISCPFHSGGSWEGGERFQPHEGISSLIAFRSRVFNALDCLGALVTALLDIEKNHAPPPRSPNRREQLPTTDKLENL